MDRPIPAFYCCYLLRSTVRHAYLYVGSTPHPVRRLRQHNGASKRGAVRTAKDKLRPWEMACIVSGFPSKIAALQFEWAWQNTHLTRHIPADERITEVRRVVRFSPKTGRARTKIARPRMSLTDKLSNLHTLLRVKSFERWPLEVTFFAEDVFKIWKRWTERTCFRIREGINVSLVRQTEVTAPKSSTSVPTDAGSANDCSNPAVDAIKTLWGIEVIDIGYGGWKPHLEKSQALLKADDPVNCRLCKETIKPEGDLSVTCPEHDCDMVSHLTCLSQTFIAQEGKAHALVPTEGDCPGCQAKLRWSTLVRDLSLRMRGQKEIDALLKKPRQRKLKVTEGDSQATTSMAEQTAHDASELESATEDDDSEDDTPQFIMPRGSEIAGLSDAEDDWIYRHDDDMEDIISMANGEHDALAVMSGAVARQPQEEHSPMRIIADSDWDDAEILD